MEKTEKRKIGDLGENMACGWLKKQGFQIIDRNYLTKFGEIDIIAKRGNKITFFEVKTVTNQPKSNFEQNDVSRENKIDDEYEPEDNIHPWKLKRLARTIEIYLLNKNIDEDEIDWQLDAISVYLEKGSNKVLKIEWLEEIV